MSTEISKPNIIGRWWLVQWVQRYDDGRMLYPLGQDAKGFIQYDEDDRMFCFICANERPALTGSQWTAPNSEKAAAYANCLAYSGRYEIRGKEVLHKVDFSLYPNWVGTTQRRPAVLEGGRLALTARLEEGTREARTAELTWRR
jgi:hypothetical protein